MALENANYISELDPVNPVGATDPKAQGDDHLRVIKKAVRQSFPNISAPVTLTAPQMNALLTTLNALIPAVPPVGTILMWSGTVAAIPAGWSLCDGSNVAGFGVVPDLRERFVMGAGTTTPGVVGGSLAKATDSQGDHQHITGSYALTVPDLPAHNHRLMVFETGAGGNTENFSGADSKGVAGENNGGAATYAYRDATTAAAGAMKLVENTGQGQQHNHGLTGVAGAHVHNIADARPLYMALCYIIRTGALPSVIP